MNVSICNGDGYGDGEGGGAGGDGKGRFTVEGMVDVDTHGGVPYCEFERENAEVSCIQSDGQRKFCADPRQVSRNNK